MKKSTALIVCVLVLSGCTSETMEPSAPEMSREEIREVIEESELSYEEQVVLAELAWESTWEDTTASDKLDMCALWFTDSDLVIDYMGDPSFSEVGQYLSPEFITDFFERSC